MLNKIDVDIEIHTSLCYSAMGFRGHWSVLFTLFSYQRKLRFKQLRHRGGLHCVLFIYLFVFVGGGAGGIRLISLTVMLISSRCITFLEVMLLFTFLKLSLQHFVLLF
jgi:hypothetical protein